MKKIGKPAILLLLCTILFSSLASAANISSITRNFRSPQWWRRNGAYMALGKTMNSGYAPLIIRNLKRELRLYRHNSSTFRTIKIQAGEALANMGRDVIPLLITTLQNTDRRIALSFVRALESFRARNAASAIARFSRDTDPELRKAVMRALGKTGSDSTLRFLWNGLQDRTTYVRIEAIDALGTMRNAASVRRLIPLLNNRNSEIRKAAAKALGKIGRRSAVPALVRALLWKKAGYDAAEALGMIGGFQAKKALIRSLSLYADYNLKAIALALAKMGGQQAVGPLLGAEWRFRRAYALKEYVQALSRFRDPRVVPMLKKYFTWNEIAAAEGIARIRGKAAVTWLLWKFRTAGHIYTKLHIARAIALTGDRRYIGLFRRILEINNPMADSWTINHLGDLKGRAIPVLLPFIDKYKNRWKRVTALRALAGTGDMRAVPVFLREIKNWNINIRIPAIQGLGNCHSTAGLPALRSILSKTNTHESLLIEALKSLVKILGREASVELRAATSHSKAGVRKAAYQLLWKLENR